MKSREFSPNLGRPESRSSMEIRRGERERGEQVRRSCQPSGSRWAGLSFLPCCHCRRRCGQATLSSADSGSTAAALAQMVHPSLSLYRLFSEPTPDNLWLLFNLRPLADSRWPLAPPPELADPRPDPLASVHFGPASQSKSESQPARSAANVQCYRPPPLARPETSWRRFHVSAQLSPARLGLAQPSPAPLSLAFHLPPIARGARIQQTPAGSAQANRLPTADSNCKTRTTLGLEAFAGAPPAGWLATLNGPASRPNRRLAKQASERQSR